MYWKNEIVVKSHNGHFLFISLSLSHVSLSHQKQKLNVTLSSAVRWDGEKQNDPIFEVAFSISRNYASSAFKTMAKNVRNSVCAFHLNCVFQKLLKEISKETPVY
jgi:hypothetical protein